PDLEPRDARDLRRHLDRERRETELQRLRTFARGELAVLTSIGVCARRRIRVLRPRRGELALTFVAHGERHQRARRSVEAIALRKLRARRSELALLQELLPLLEERLGGDLIRFLRSHLGRRERDEQRRKKAAKRKRSERAPTHRSEVSAWGRNAQCAPRNA